MFGEQLIARVPNPQTTAHYQDTAYSEEGHVSGVHASLPFVQVELHLRVHWLTTHATQFPSPSQLSRQAIKVGDR